MDIGFARLNPVAAKKIFRLFCEPGRLESLYIRAESHRFEDDKPDSSNRDWYWETKCERSVRLNNCEVKADIESQLSVFFLQIITFGSISLSCTL